MKVTTYSPMKRGLKVRYYEVFRLLPRSYNLFPDEKGTESQIKAIYHAICRSYNLFPDEKGTESLSSRLVM